LAISGAALVVVVGLRKLPFKIQRLPVLTDGVLEMPAPRRTSVETPRLARGGTAVPVSDREAPAP
jgi:hypothetical protein